MSEFIENINLRLLPFLCLQEMDYVKKNTDKDVLETIYKRWETLEFTKGMEDGDNEICAIAFEQMAVLMLRLKYGFYDKILETIIFPVIRKVISDVGGEKYSTKKCLDAICEQPFSKLHDKIVLSERYTENLDAEAELCSIMATALCMVMLGEIEPKDYYSAVEKGVNGFINNLGNE